MRLETSDAGNDPTGTSTYNAFNLLSQGFGPGFNGPLLVAVELHGRAGKHRSCRSARRSRERPMWSRSPLRECRRRAGSR